MPDHGATHDVQPMIEIMRMEPRNETRHPNDPEDLLSPLWLRLEG